MKKLLFLLLTSCVLIFSCSKEELDPVLQNNTEFVEQFTEFASTKSIAPFYDTIWECEVEGEFNLYMWFWSDSMVNVFYGKVDDGVLQRWSAFYGGDDPYWSPDENLNYGGASYLINERYELSTNLRFPLFGSKELVESIEMGKFENNFTLKSGDKTFKYFGKPLYTEQGNDLDGLWMSIIASIVPWK